MTWDEVRDVGVWLGTWNEARDLRMRPGDETRDLGKMLHITYTCPRVP